MENNICFKCFCEKPEGAVFCPNCGFDNKPNKEKYPLALPEGTIVGGNFIIGKVLGQGGFGITYIAKNHKTGELVAIKEFYPETMATRTDNTTVTNYSADQLDAFAYGKECFLQEAKTLAEFIGNDNIVKIHSYFEENGTAYFVMEYVQGKSLKDYINEKGGKLSWQETADLLYPIMDALSIVHSKGIIHRDISPDNIIITDNGGVKLIDFGAARYSIGDRSRSLDVVLKHGYAPKEQYTRRGKQGPFTDIYSLAATYYSTVTGRVPPDSIDRLEEDNLAAPSALGTEMPEYAEDAILKALSVNYSDRYQHVEEFKNALYNLGNNQNNYNTVNFQNNGFNNQNTYFDYNQQNTNNSGKGLFKNKKLVSIIAAALVVVIIAGIGVTVTLTSDNRNNYNKAVELIEDKSYYEAMELLEPLAKDDYKDSKSKLSSCKDKFFAQLDEEVSDLIDEGDYEAALKKISSVDKEYSDETESIYVNYVESMVYKEAYEQLFSYIKDNKSLKASLSGISNKSQEAIANNIPKFSKLEYNDGSLFIKSAKSVLELYEAVDQKTDYYNNLNKLYSAASKLENVYDADFRKAFDEVRDDFIALWDFEPTRNLMCSDDCISHFMVGYWKSGDNYFYLYYPDDYSTLYYEDSIPYNDTGKENTFEIDNMVLTFYDESKNAVSEDYEMSFEDANTMLLKVYLTGKTVTYYFYRQ